MLSLRRVLAIPVLFSLALVLGCGAPTQYISTPDPIEQLDTYAVLEVAPPRTDGEEFLEITEEEVLSIQEALVERLQKKKVMPEVTFKTDATDRVMLVNSTITRFDTGSQAARYFVGFGAGVAKMVMHVALVDKGTGTTIAETDVQNKIRGGFFGGSANARNMGKEIAKGVEKFIRKKGKGGKRPGTTFN
jgi:hypothetical protein